MTANREVPSPGAGWAQPLAAPIVARPASATLRWPAGPRLSDIRSQYRIIESGAGWVERTGRGRLRVDGADRVAFLQALVTNDLTALGPARGVYAAYLTPQGRLVADLTVYDRGDHLLADVPAALAGSLLTKLDALVFSEDVRISDVSASIVAFGVMGRQAESVVRQTTFFAVPTDVASHPAFDVFVPRESRAEAIAALEAAGARSVSEALADLLRIEAGRPAFGPDMDDQTIPLEAGLLDRAISLTKGCYVGQEVIVRVLHRGGGRVARRLVTLAFDPALETPPAAGAVLVVDGREAGRVTSAAWSPGAGRVVALGYLTRDTAEPGRQVTTSVDGRDTAGRVVAFAG